MEKKVNELIKLDMLFSRGSFYGDYTNLPVFHKIVKANRLDLVKKMLDACYDDEERKELVNYNVDNDGWKTNYKGLKPIDLAKDDEMKNLLNKWK
jgi:hypothetical protein